MFEQSSAISSSNIAASERPQTGAVSKFKNIFSESQDSQSQGDSHVGGGGIRSRMAMFEKGHDGHKERHHSSDSNDSNEHRKRDGSEERKSRDKKKASRRRGSREDSGNDRKGKRKHKKKEEDDDDEGHHRHKKDHKKKKDEEKKKKKKKEKQEHKSNDKSGVQGILDAGGDLLTPDNDAITALSKFMGTDEQTDYLKLTNRFLENQVKIKSEEELQIIKKKEKEIAEREAKVKKEEEEIKRREEEAKKEAAKKEEEVKAKNNLSSHGVADNGAVLLDPTVAGASGYVRSSQMNPYAQSTAHTLYNNYHTEATPNVIYVEATPMPQTEPAVQFVYGGGHSEEPHEHVIHVVDNNGYQHVVDYNHHQHNSNQFQPEEVEYVDQYGRPLTHDQIAEYLHNHPEDLANEQAHEEVRYVDRNRAHYAPKPDTVLYKHSRNNRASRQSRAHARSTRHNIPQPNFDSLHDNILTRFSDEEDIVSMPKNSEPSAPISSQQTVASTQPKVVTPPPTQVAPPPPPAPAVSPPPPPPTQQAPPAPPPPPTQQAPPAPPPPPPPPPVQHPPLRPPPSDSPRPIPEQEDHPMDNLIEEIKEGKQLKKTQHQQNSDSPPKDDDIFAEIRSGKKLKKVPENEKRVKTGIKGRVVGELSEDKDGKQEGRRRKDDSPKRKHHRHHHSSDEDAEGDDDRRDDNRRDDRGERKQERDEDKIGRRQEIMERQNRDYQREDDRNRKRRAEDGDHRRRRRDEDRDHRRRDEDRDHRRRDEDRYHRKRDEDRDHRRRDEDRDHRRRDEDRDHRRRDEDGDHRRRDEDREREDYNRRESADKNPRESRGRQNNNGTYSASRADESDNRRHVTTEQRGQKLPDLGIKGKSNLKSKKEAPVPAWKAALLERKQGIVEKAEAAATAKESTASAAVDPSLPAWKQAVLMKKKQLEKAMELDAQSEDLALAHLPDWKRKLVKKKNANKAEEEEAELIKNKAFFDKKAELATMPEWKKKLFLQKFPQYLE